MGMQFLRVALEPTKLSYLVCIACGGYHCHFAIKTNPKNEPEAGVHKQCIPSVKVKRGAS